MDSDITYTLANATVAFYDSFDGLVKWFARRSDCERSAMATACVLKLALSSFGNFSLMSWSLMEFSLGSTIISAKYHIRDPCLYQTKRKEGGRLTGFSSDPSS